uniref:Small EDRK-rich factor-like N-terminal domain-containing protein n=1 Tax=Scleropages formosus TaxID=113540 RepID=A0A8C9RAW4_SCLFO
GRRGQRGQHKLFQSQQKNARRQAEAKKRKGHNQKVAAKAAPVRTCSVCRVSDTSAQTSARVLVGTS